MRSEHRLYRSADSALSPYMQGKPRYRILPEQYDPQQELITLRSIVAREDLVNNLSEAVHAHSQNRAWDKKDMLLSLRRMRSASLAVVENIVIWRHSLTKS